MESNFYLARVASTNAGLQASIWRNVGGSYHKLTTGQTIPSASGTLEFEAVGSSLKVFFNSQLLAFANDTALSSGSVGIRLGQNATLDNFAAAAVL